MSNLNFYLSPFLPPSPLPLRSAAGGKNGGNKHEIESSIPPYINHPDVQSGGGEGYFANLINSFRHILAFYLQSRVDTRLSQYQARPAGDTVRFPQIALQYLLEDVEAILIKNYYPFKVKAERGQAPQPPVESPSKEANHALLTQETEIKPSSKREQRRLKEMCLRRDRYLCISTSLPDMASPEEGHIRYQGSDGAHTEVATACPSPGRTLVMVQSATDRQQIHDLSGAVSLFSST